MKCPYCHNENKYDNLSCDFCLQVLPMTETRKQEIKIKKAAEKKAKYQKSVTKIIGMVAAVLFIIGTIILIQALKK